MQRRVFSIIDLATGKLLYTSPKELSILPNKIFPIGNDRVLLKSDRHGLFSFNLKTKELKPGVIDTWAFNKSDRQINVVTRDNQGNEWIGYRNGGFQVISPELRQIKLSNNKSVVTETEGKSISNVICMGQIIIGVTDNHLFTYNMQTDQTVFTNQDDIFFDSPYFRQEINKLLPGRTADEVFVCTNVRILQCKIVGGKIIVTRSTNPGTFIGDAISVKGHIIAPSVNNGIVDYKIADGRYRLIKTGIQGFYQDTKPTLLSNGNVLFFLRGMRVVVYDGHRFQEKKIIGLSDNLYAMPTFAITDHRGKVWLGSKRTGLYCINSQLSSALKLQLASNNINSIAVSVKNYIYLGTDEGITFIQPNKDLVRVFPMIHILSHGSSPSVIGKNGLCQLSDLDIFAGTSNGCMILPIKSMREKRKFNLNVKSINVSRNGTQMFSVGDHVDGTKHYTFAYKDNDLEFEFGQPSYGRPEADWYEVKVEGLDNHWRTPTQSGVVLLSNVPSGNYTLHIRMMQTPGATPLAESQLHFTILSSPWSSAWAWLLYLLIFAAVLIYINILFLRIRRNHMELELAHNDSERERRTNEMNMSFFANISHEFRNPLTLISGPVMQLRRNKDLPLAARQKLDIISQSVNRMLRLIDQMLDFNKLENDALKLQVAEGDLVEALRHQAQIFKESTDMEGIVFETRLPQEPLYAWFDSDKIEKILSNLFTNALKHTQQGNRITLAMNADEGIVHISLWNEGSSIPEAKLPDVFKRYYQIKEINTDHHYGFGTGIGLYYVARLVEMQHGKIDVANRDGGVDFFFTIPIERKAYSEGEIRKATIANEEKDKQASTSKTQLLDDKAVADATDATSIGKSRVLIVDDDVEMSRYIRSIFVGDYDVVNRYSAEAALHDLEAIHPDIVLSDVVMADMTGYDFCRTIKNDQQFSHIPVILITAKSNMKEQIEGLNCGADAYVTKPFDPDYLLSLVRSQLRNRLIMQRHLASSVKLSGDSDALSPQDKAFMEQLYATLQQQLHEKMDINLDDICQQMGMSRAKLNYKVKGLTGETPNNFFKTYKLNYSAELLRSGKYNISEVAMMAGFGTLSYFSFCFKKRFGINPSEYK